eukprot:2644190-Amphidinium_carterae.1
MDTSPKMSSAYSLLTSHTPVEAMLWSVLSPRKSASQQLDCSTTDNCTGLRDRSTSQKYPTSCAAHKARTLSHTHAHAPP